MPGSAELPVAELPLAISQLLHTALITAQSKHPLILTEPCRKWLLLSSTEAQLSKISALLEKQPDRRTLLKAVEHSFEQMFIPAFKGSKAHAKLWQQIQTLAAAPKASVDGLNQRSDEALPSVSENNSALDPAGLLLLDAENMNPPEELEKALQTIGQYPMRYRLAFGNWRKLGDRDQELYQRGYQMVHVPSGKNSADIKMSLDAFLISLRNPSIREVFICSTDADLLHLGHALLNLGITTYRVSRHSNGFAVENIGTQTSQIVPDAAVPATVRIPTLAQMKGWLKSLILQEQQANPGQPITIGQLGKLFRDRNQISANQALQASSDYKTLKQFLEAHEQLFVLKPLPGSDQLEVTLKASSGEPTQPHQPTVPSAVNTVPQPITNAHTLEQALIKLLWSLSSPQTGGTVRLCTLSSQFAKVHKEPINQALKRIGEPKGLPKFLQKCRSLRAQKQGQEWHIALVCVS